MKYSEQIRPVSYLKSHTADLIRELSETGKPMVITQNGEATAVIQDIKTWENQQETLALLKLLALSQQELNAGKVVSLEEMKDHLKRNRRDS